MFDGGIGPVSDVIKMLCLDLLLASIALEGCVFCVFCMVCVCCVCGACPLLGDSLILGQEGWNGIVEANVGAENGTLETADLLAPVSRPVPLWAEDPKPIPDPGPRGSLGGAMAGGG